MAAAPTSIRRNILALLAGLSLVSYLLRSNNMVLENRRMSALAATWT
jgi:hypothetical protein